MVIHKILNPRNDLAFKKIFGTVQNSHLVISFLNIVLKNQLEAPIKTVEFLKKDQDPEISSKRQSVVDVLCKDEKGVKYIIEMQVAKSEGFKERAVLYASRAYIAQMHRETKYQDLKEVIFLALCNFNIMPQKKHYKSEHQLLDIQTKERDLKALSFTFINLPKFEKEIAKRKVSLEAMTLEEKWYYFLSNAEEISIGDIDKLAGSDKVIKEAFNALDSFNWTEGELMAYEDILKAEMDNEAAQAYRLKTVEARGERRGMERGLERGMERGIERGMERGMEKGLEIGREEGENQNAVRTAKIMLADGESIAKISKYTGLLKEEIEKLRN